MSGSILRTVGKIALLAVLLFGVVGFTGPQVLAQRREHIGGGRIVVVPRYRFYPGGYWYGGYYPGYYPYYYESRVTEAQGFKDGRHDGEHDAKHNKSYSPQRHHDYSAAGTQTYLNAYVQGYAQGFRDNRG